MYVNKSNYFIQNACFNLEALESKILAKIISLIDSKTSEFKQYYEFEVADFIKELNLGSKTNYKLIKDSAKNLSDKGFYLPNEDKNKSVYSRWVTSVISEKDTGVIRFEIPLEMKNFYLNLNKSFTSYQANIVYGFQSTYTIRFYELLNSYKQLTKITFSVKELKEKFSIVDKYSRYFNFKTNVLEVAKKELIKKDSDLYFTYSEKGIGNRKKITFYIKKKSRSLNLPTENLFKTNNIYQQLLELKMSKKEILTLFSTYSEKQIEKNLNYTIDQYNQGKINKHIKAFLRAAIKNNYADNEYQKAKKQTPKTKKETPKIVKPVKKEPPKLTKQENPELETKLKTTLKSNFSDSIERFQELEFIFSNPKKGNILEVHGVEFKIQWLKDNRFKNKLKRILKNITNELYEVYYYIIE